MRTLLTLLFLGLYLVGVYPSSAVSASREVAKVQVTHSHEHGHHHHHHHHHHHAESSDESNSLPVRHGDSHTHDILIVACSTCHIVSTDAHFLAPLEFLSPIAVSVAQSQVGQRLTSIFRPPIS